MKIIEKVCASPEGFGGQVSPQREIMILSESWSRKSLLETVDKIPFSSSRISLRLAGSSEGSRGTSRLTFSTICP